MIIYLSFRATQEGVVTTWTGGEAAAKELAVTTGELELAAPGLEQLTAPPPRGENSRCGSKPAPPSPLKLVSLEFWCSCGLWLGREWLGLWMGMECEGLCRGYGGLCRVLGYGYVGLCIEWEGLCVKLRWGGLIKGEWVAVWFLLTASKYIHLLI